jgi:hypothetical protein
MKRACFHKNTKTHEDFDMRVPSDNLKTNNFRMKQKRLQFIERKHSVNSVMGFKE